LTVCIMGICPKIFCLQISDIKLLETFAYRVRVNFLF